MTDGRPAILLDERTANWRARSIMSPKPGRLDMKRRVEELAAVAGWSGDKPRTMNLEQHLDMDTTKIRRDFGYRETLWDRDYWPKEVDTAQFDYAAEDAILNDR